MNAASTGEFQRSECDPAVLDFGVRGPYSRHVGTAQWDSGLTRAPLPVAAGRLPQTGSMHMRTPSNSNAEVN